MDKYAIRFPKHMTFTDDEFYAFCLENRDLKFERAAQGEIIIMSPTGGITGKRNTAIVSALDNWNRKYQSGEVFDSSTGFRLPNGAVRSPDATWVANARWAALTQEEKEKFPPLCPDFVVELISSSDNLQETQEKMQEWMANGCRLGWLIFPQKEKVIIYESQQPTQEIVGFDQKITGGSVLPDFTLDLSLLK